MLFFVTILMLSATSSYSWYCEDSEWTEYQGKCYYFYGEPSGVGTAQACQSYCFGESARMLCIEDEDKEKFIRDQAPYYASAWLDYSDVVNEGTYIWGSGCDNTGYVNWFAPVAENQGPSVNCATYDPNFPWRPTSCDDSSFCYCEKAAIASTPVCPVGWALNDGVCYLLDVVKDPTTWYGCQDTCSAYNGRMLCLRNPSDEAFIIENVDTKPSVWLSYNNQKSMTDWIWGPNCDYTNYTNWDTLHGQPNYDDSWAVCSKLDVNSTSWSNAHCDSFDLYETYCICEGSSGDPRLVPYVAPPSDDGTGSSSGTLGGIIFGAVVGGILVAVAIALLLRHWYNIRSAAASEDYSAVNTARAAVPPPPPSPYAGSASYNGTYATSNDPYAYSANTSGVNIAPGQYAAAAQPNAYTGGYTGGYSGGGTVAMVPLAPSAPPAPAPSGPTYTAQGGYSSIAAPAPMAPAYYEHQHQQQQAAAGSKTTAPASAPAPAVMVATATAVPYSPGPYDGDHQVVMAVAVVDSANV